MSARKVGTFALVAALVALGMFFVWLGVSAKVVALAIAGQVALPFLVRRSRESTSSSGEGATVGDGGGPAQGSSDCGHGDGGGGDCGGGDGGSGH